MSHARLAAGLVVAAGVWAGGVALRAQGAAAPPAQLAEQVFKNVQILRGIPVDQFMQTMGFFSASTGLNCTDCHTADSGGDWAKYADDNDLKRTARRMMLMVDSLNRVNFGGRQVVTCDTCHRGTSPPSVMPSLTRLYAELSEVEPENPFTQAPGQPAPAVILDRFVAAAGGAPRLAALTSFTAQGTTQGFDDSEAHPVEIAATAAGRRATVIKAAAGSTAQVVDGAQGWHAAPLIDRPLPVMALTGAELEGMKLEARVFFPATLAGALANWRSGYPTLLNDRTVVPVQGDLPGGGVATLIFDAESGLLTRLVRFGPSPVGRLVTRVDYDDYREVAGVKLPFKWTVSWLSGRSRFEMTAVQPNVRIDPARFGRPR